MSKNTLGEIPQFFQPILWSYDFTRIDPWRDKNTIIVNAVNYGDLQHLQWLVQFYGKENVREVLRSIPRTALRKRVLPLISLLFQIQEWSHA